MNDNSKRRDEELTGDDLAQRALANAGDDTNSSSQATQTDPNSASTMTTTADEVAASDALADTLTALQNVIERNAQELTRVTNELKQKRESLQNVFENDIELGEAEAQAQAVLTQLKERKSKLQTDPQATTLKVQIGDLNQEKKEIEETLSNHLVNYYQITQSKSFDTSDGDQWEFDIRAKVKTKKN